MDGALEALEGGFWAPRALRRGHAWRSEGGEKVNDDEGDVSSSCQQSGLNKPSLHSPTNQHPPSTIQEPRHVSGRGHHFRHFLLQGDDLA